MYVAFLFNNTYFFFVSFSPLFNFVLLDANTDSVSIKSTYVQSIHFNNFFKNMQKLLRLFHAPLFLKIRFKNKGYYVYKNKRSTIAPQFNYSHRVYVYSFFLVVKFLTKTKIFVFGYNHLDIKKFATSFKHLRPMNIFTGRGVRFSRQIVYKKTGKVSTYR